MRREIDNFNLIADRFFSDSNGVLDEGEFFFVQILLRGKDGHRVSGHNKHRLVKYYTITSKQQLLDLKEEIIEISKAVTGRVYIHPAKCSFKEVANVTLELSTHMYVSQNWVGMRSVFSTAAGKSFIVKDKKYIVDIDDVDLTTAARQHRVETISECIKEIRGKGGSNIDKVFLVVPTKSGVHLITDPFDVGAFQKSFPNIDVHKNNPTLLYFSREE